MYGNGLKAFILELVSTVTLNAIRYRIMEPPKYDLKACVIHCNGIKAL